MVPGPRHGSLSLLSSLDSGNKSVRITNNITWLPHNTPLPTATTEDLIVASAHDLTAALLHQKPTDLIPPITAETRKVLLQLSTIFADCVHPTDANVISTPLTEKVPPIPKWHAPQVPRVPPEKQEHSPSDAVPRVPKKRSNTAHQKAQQNTYTIIQHNNN